MTIKLWKISLYTLLTATLVLVFSFAPNVAASDTIRVSVARDGKQGNSDSWISTSTEDENYAVVDSTASNSVSWDANIAEGVFERELDLTSLNNDNFARINTKPLFIIIRTGVRLN